LDPKPPPTYGEVTRTSALSSPNSPASVVATPCAPWVESNSRTLGPGSQVAMQACGSIGLLCSIGVVYRWSTSTGAARSASSTSPSAVSVG
jgi:hypothetical protein